MAQLHRGRQWFVRILKRSLDSSSNFAALVVLVVALVVVCGFGVVQAQGEEQLILRDESSSREAVTADTDDDGGEAGGADQVEDAGTEVVVVDIDGAVVSPSVVELPAGSRVADAIERVGGLTEDADVSTVNRASVLTDGQKIHIPSVEEGSSQVQSGDSGHDDVQSQTLININVAGLEELDELPGVGPATAQAILDDRTQNGPFASIEDIMRVSGIGEAKFEKMRSRICV